MTTQRAYYPMRRPSVESVLVMATSRSNVPDEIERQARPFEAQSFGIFLTAWGQWVIGIRRGDWNNSDLFCAWAKTLATESASETKLYFYPPE